MSSLMIVTIVLVVVALGVIALYNKLVAARFRTKEAWSTVETQLKRRYDLIPNLVETVKAYAKYENKTLEQVVTARNMAMSVRDMSTQKEQYENMLTSSLKSLFALSENYPDLKANQNFLDLQREITDTEDKIQASRQFYNTMVLSYNTQVQVFPSNLLANMFHFQQENFFKLEESERAAANQPVKVEF